MGDPLEPDTEAILEVLDRYKDVRGTLPIFDALWTGDAEHVQHTLANHLSHPLAPELADWLERRGFAVPQAPSDVEILEQRGVTDVSAWIDRHEREAAQLKRERDHALQVRSDALKAANGLSLMLVLVSAVAVLGWLAAFGVFSFSPLPMPDGKPLPHDGSGSGEDPSTGSP